MRGHIAEASVGGIDRMRQWAGGIAAAVTAALTIPLAVGAFAIVPAPAAAEPGASGTVSAVEPPPPPVTKSDGGTDVVKPPAPVGDFDPEAIDRRVVAAPAPAANGCTPASPGLIPGAPSKVSPKGVLGTTTADLASFAQAYNAKRVAACLKPIPPANFRYDACMEARLFWIAEDPSTDPTSAWGHIGTVRSDGVPSVGCDGNLAGGMNNTGETVARKWWDSTGHRSSLYRPTYTGSTSSVCIFFAMTHGGVPNEPAAFTRAAARWGSC